MSCAVDYFDANALELDFHFAEREFEKPSLILMTVITYGSCILRPLYNRRDGNHSSDLRLKTS